jgi:hypothetical protein
MMIMMTRVNMMAMAVLMIKLTRVTMMMIFDPDDYGDQGDHDDDF